MKNIALTTLDLGRLANVTGGKTVPLPHNKSSNRVALEYFRAHGGKPGQKIAYPASTMTCDKHGNCSYEAE
jgi:hypothetical protein